MATNQAIRNYLPCRLKIDLRLLLPLPRRSIPFLSNLALVETEESEITMDRPMAIFEVRNIGQTHGTPIFDTRRWPSWFAIPGWRQEESVVEGPCKENVREIRQIREACTC